MSVRAQNLHYHVGSQDLALLYRTVPTRYDTVRHGGSYGTIEEALVLRLLGTRLWGVLYLYIPVSVYRYVGIPTHMPNEEYQIDRDANLSTVKKKEDFEVYRQIVSNCK